MDAQDLLTSCLNQKMAFVPREPFHPTDGGNNTMRIYFSNAIDEEINQGI